MISVPNAAETTSLAKSYKSGAEEGKLRKACEGFEAIFIHKMMQTMRKATEDGGLIPKSNAEKIFTDMMDEELSNAAAAKSVNGIADMLFEQLKGTLASSTPDAAREQAAAAAFFPELRR